MRADRSATNLSAADGPDSAGGVVIVVAVVDVVVLVADNDDDGRVDWVIVGPVPNKGDTVTTP